MNIGIDSAAQLSAQLRSLRKALGLTQAQLGTRLGVKQTRMADIEKSPGLVSVAQMLQVLHALDAQLQLSLPNDSAAPPGPPVKPP